MALGCLQPGLSSKPPCQHPREQAWGDVKAAVEGAHSSYAAGSQPHASTLGSRQEGRREGCTGGGPFLLCSWIRAPLPRPQVGCKAECGGRQRRKAPSSAAIDRRNAKTSAGSHPYGEGLAKVGL